MDPLVIGSLISGAASAFGQRSANKKNLAIARENRAWQERMSSTAHQREVKDLRKAGLNPILSAMGGSGSSTPAGNTATMQDELGPAVNSALSTRRLAQDLKNLQANENLTNTQSKTEKFKQAESLARIGLLKEQKRVTGNAAAISDLPAELAASAKNLVDSNKNRVLSGTHPIQEKSSMIINDLIDAGVGAVREVTSAFDARRARTAEKQAWVEEFTRLNKRPPTYTETKNLFDKNWRKK